MKKIAALCTAVILGVGISGCGTDTSEDRGRELPRPGATLDEQKYYPNPPCTPHPDHNPCAW